jgi:hypothetical protein
MLAEANYAAVHLHLHVNPPITQAEIRRAYVAPPRLLRHLASLDTDDYSFGFGESGRLRFITLLHPFGNQPLPRLRRRLALIHTEMTSEGAYELATNWLTALSVDVAALDRKYAATKRQHFYLGGGSRRILLPIFDVLWGSADKPSVIVSVYGLTGDLLQLRQTDESFSGRPAGSENNVEYLLSIPDPEFKEYTDSQRTELVKAFGSNSVNRTPFQQAGATTLRLETPNAWSTLLFLLNSCQYDEPSARNFLFFGRFDRTNLGGSDNPGQGINKGALANALKNSTTEKQIGSNLHPYRFVFIDGCNTASSDLCTVFGISKIQTSVEVMWNGGRGLVPRAYVGWSSYK